MMQSPTVRSLPAQPLTSDAFRPFGQVIAAIPDGKSFDRDDAQLVLDRGTPRFYIMRLTQRGRRFSHITRHQHCTQCLGSLAGQPWLIAVAPPSPADRPSLTAITAFQVPGDCFIKLELGTWHAGPYFDQPSIDFYNLELSDTNFSDHQTCDLLTTDNTLIEIVESA